MDPKTLIERPRFMQTSFRTLPAGFTLIELMVALAVVAILAAIVTPSYMNSIKKSRRTDAKTALLDLASREERFFSTNNAYVTSAASAASLGYPSLPLGVPSATQTNYTINVAAPAGGGVGYTATAAPSGGQVGDACGTYAIDDKGNQTNSGGTLSGAACW